MASYRVNIDTKHVDYSGVPFTRGYVCVGSHDVYLWGETSDSGLVHLSTASRRILETFGPSAVGGLWVKISPIS
jgi:hypothetical protein